MEDGLSQSVLPLLGAERLLCTRANGAPPVHIAGPLDRRKCCQHGDFGPCKLKAEHTFTSQDESRTVWGHNWKKPTQMYHVCKGQI